MPAEGSARIGQPLSQPALPCNRKMVARTIQLKLFADLRRFMPPEGEAVVIASGTTVGDLLRRLGLPVEKAKLIFIDGAQADLSATLQGGERVGIFPPVGGG